MSAGPSGPDARTVIVPAGAPILTAARWVAVSCRAELALHEVLTDLLRGGSEPEAVSTLWTVRAHRAEIAEGWHRRLPELREFPRDSLLADAADVAEDDAADAVDGASTGPASLAVVRERLLDLEARYVDHLDRAVGPADGPVADLLVRAIAVTAEDRLALS